MVRKRKPLVIAGYLETNKASMMKTSPKIFNGFQEFRISTIYQ